LKINEKIHPIAPDDGGVITFKIKPGLYQADLYAKESFVKKASSFTSLAVLFFLFYLIVRRSRKIEK
jgi:hypothetical protein